VGDKLRELAEYALQPFISIADVDHHEEIVEGWRRWFAENEITDQGMARELVEAHIKARCGV